MATESKNPSSTLENKSEIGEENVSAGTRENIQQLNDYEVKGTIRPPSDQTITTISLWRGITSPLVVLLMNPGQTGDQMGGLIALVEYAK